MRHVLKSAVPYESINCGKRDHVLLWHAGSGCDLRECECTTCHARAALLTTVTDITDITEPDLGFGIPLLTSIELVLSMAFMRLRPPAPKHQEETEKKANGKSPPTRLCFLATLCLSCSGS
ncbi:hypothetical protein ZIOFF_019606 [Zingiber officinale]|uniref:Uncharacterized protein n=1 Tax=Zingiber officinale TaxID=94328 RepID=A0A8J5LJD0_ZINOF|nr:hypothetical protein ZIOFF_019606 [Zingiber officinale]